MSNSMGRLWNGVIRDGRRGFLRGAAWFFLGMGLSLMAERGLAQAPVSFSSGTFTGDSVLAVAGPPDQEIYGVDLGDSTARMTANGYVFGADSSTNVFYGASGSYTTFLGGGGSTGDAAFDAVLNTGRVGGGSGLLTLSNLTAGVAYQVLFILADTRSTTGGRTFSLTSDGAASPGQVYAFAGGTPSMGGFVLGTFTAAGTTQTFSNSAAAYGYQLNAVLVCGASYNADWPEVQGIVGQYTGSYSNAPTNYISGAMSDAPLLGNGDIGVTVGGTDVYSQQFCVSKIDFITDGSGEGSCLTLGGINVRMNSNLAWNQTVTADSYINSNQTPQDAVDGNLTTKWCTANGAEPHWLVVDMGRTNSVSRWVVKHAGGSGETTNYNTRDFALQASNDGLHFTNIDSVTGNTANVTDRNVTNFSSRYLRLYITKATQLTNDTHARIYELEAYASPLTNGNGSYLLQEDLLNAEVRSTLNNGIKMRSWLADTENDLVIEMWTEGATPIPVSVDTWTKSDNSGYPSSAGVTNGILWATRETKQTGVRFISRAAIATKILDAAPVTNRYSGGTASASFTLNPGATVRIVSSIGGGGQNPTNHLSSALARAGQMSDAAVSALKAGHTNWWQSYWLRSYVKLPYPLVEKFYYGALYESGCYARSNSPAGVGPGLYFWVTKDSPNWSSDSHLNYNAEAPFFGVFSANRSEAVLPYADEMIAFEPEGLRRAQQEMGLVRSNLVGEVCNGLLYPVGIMPWGYSNNVAYDTQLSDASFGGQPLIWYYYHTLDTNFLATKLYPFATNIMAFWESYLSDDGTNYYFYDGAHEFAWGLNPGMTLGAIRMYANLCLTASATLGVDSGSRAKWQDITNRLSAYPTMSYNGKTIYSDYQGSLGSAPGGNPCNLEFIYAFDGLGLDSSPSALQIASDSITQGKNWNNANGFCRIYGMAARVGYNPTAIITNLINTLSLTNFDRNLMDEDGVNGIEKAGTVGGINDLLLQSNEGIIKLFPVWPTNMPAKFKRLRARGAFLVDCQWTNNGVLNPSIFSEKGAVCNVLNPWPGKPLYVSLNGNAVATTNAGNRYSFSTAAGDTYVLSTNPAGSGVKIVSQPAQTLTARAWPGSQIILAWANNNLASPTNAVYCTPDLTPPTVWTLVTNIPVGSNNQWIVTLPIGTNGQMFYKLQ